MAAAATAAAASPPWGSPPVAEAHVRSPFQAFEALPDDLHISVAPAPDLNPRADPRTDPPRRAGSIVATEVRSTPRRSESLNPSRISPETRQSI